MRIWVDADACPGEARTLLLRFSRRLSLPLVLVANRGLDVSSSPLVETRVVPPQPDAADRAIARDVQPGDLVVTADIALAVQAVEKGAAAIDPRGEVYTEDDVRARLQMRNLMEGLRGAGLLHGGPSEYGDVDKQRFAAALDRVLTRLLRAGAGRPPPPGPG